MALPVLICDDSRLARKQLAKALPAEWDIRISFAANGAEAIEAIRAGHGDLLFLDLNMPVMDGYEVLEAIRTDDLPSMAIVVSGDIQEGAHQRVKKLGALDFIHKPINADKVSAILRQYGLFDEISTATRSTDEENNQPIALDEIIQEVSNIAMGQAGARLGRLLNTFVKLPVPKIHRIHFAQLSERIAARRFSSLSAIAEGFCGNNIYGEALLLVDEQSFSRLFGLFDYNQRWREVSDLEVLVDLASVIAGACVHSIGVQLDLQLSHSHPVMLGRQQKVDDLLNGHNADQNVLAVEVNYSLPEHEVECDLLIVFTEKSIERLADRAGCL